jgi:2-oxo-3-hexenedioate decarboxylase
MEPAEELYRALSAGRPLAPFSIRGAPLGREGGLRAGAGLRRRLGLSRVGRKIGFTNRALWPLYGVDGPIWGEVGAQTLIEADAAPLAGLLEPRIEPEIALGLIAPPAPGMDRAALARCVGWAAPALEIVQSVYPGWRFDVDEAQAANGLHGRLKLGARAEVDPEALAETPATLRRNGEIVERGLGANALGGPLDALAALVAALAAEGAEPLAAGELVSTGTLTDAWTIAPGERWSAAFGPPLDAAVALAFA